MVLTGYSSAEVIEKRSPVISQDFHSWLAQMLARKPKMLVTVALANKMSRIIWAALLLKGGTYRTPVAAA
jgi:hypothetical protein